MSTETLISIELYCRHEEVDLIFVQALTERGLLQVVVQEEQHYLAPDQVARLEQLARMHFELDINLEGIEAISHLLERVDHMQRDLRTLQQRLRLYEAPENRPRSAAVERTLLRTSSKLLSETNNAPP